DNDCDTPLRGNPDKVRLVLLRNLNQKLEYFLTRIKGPNEDITINRGINQVDLTTSGLKNFTFNISFKTDSSFCNGAEEPINVTIKLVNATVFASHGGYFFIPENERTKELNNLYPNQQRQITFKGLNFAPNVVTDLELQLVSIQGNRCRTDLFGDSQRVRINLSDSRIGQEIEYFIQNLTNGTYA
ncbi:MAG: hypothetical protein N3E37_06090, partial [Candidatus Micrarchaeota archaeon]|nr:hypothetical protein [Candidatus Micrarchaeota archaeon]